MLVQRTEQIDVAFGDLLPFFLVGMNVDRLVADDNDAFEFLGSEDGADTAAGMLTGADEHGHRNEVFTGRSDHAIEAIGEVWSASICCARRVPWPQMPLASRSSLRRC